MSAAHLQKRPAVSRRPAPSYAFELAAGAGAARRVAGVDEAGRGALAGPVVAAAVILDPQRLPRGLRGAIRDSKQLSPRQRERLAEQLLACAEVGIGQSGAAEIDRFGVARATLAAMASAVEALPQPPDVALIDGPLLPVLACEARAIIGGDHLCLSIAAASIIAKVTRDRIMTLLAMRYPGYGWEHNAGYGTPAQLAALVQLGPVPPHRRSFAPLRR